MSQCTVNVMLWCFVFLIKAVKKIKSSWNYLNFLPLISSLICIYTDCVCVCYFLHWVPQTWRMTHWSRRWRKTISGLSSSVLAFTVPYCINQCAIWAEWGVRIAWLPCCDRGTMAPFFRVSYRDGGARRIGSIARRREGRQGPSSALGSEGSRHARYISLSGIGIS